MMKRIRYCQLILGGVAVITFVSAPSLACQGRSARSQEEVARDLRSYDRDVVARALGHVP